MRYTIAALAAAAVIKASPLPQAVTAAISPVEAPPPGCTLSRPDSFGIAAMNLTTESDSPARRQLLESAINSPTKCGSTAKPASDQPTAPGYTLAPISMILDGQIQGGMHTMTMTPVSQIADDQPQAPARIAKAPVNQFPNTQPQPQPSTTLPIPPSSTPSPPPPSSPPQSTTPSPNNNNNNNNNNNTTTTTTNTTTTLVACRTPSTLELTLSSGGVLKDSLGRTGYIASNYQFQFDAPPQSGAIYTSGFSVCGNGSLALGGSNVFYQCLSGSFYNLYDRHWAPQCSPVTIETLRIQVCD